MKFSKTVGSEAWINRLYVNINVLLFATTTALQNAEILTVHDGIFVQHC